MNRKKQYVAPVADVVKLQTQNVMLTASVSEAEKSGYGNQNDLGTWEE